MPDTFIGDELRARGVKAKRLVPAGNRNNVMTSWSSAGTSMVQSRIRRRSGSRGIVFPRFLIPNWIAKADGTEEANATSITFKGYVELGGVRYQATRDESAAIVVPAGMTGRSEAFPLFIPPNTDYWIGCLVDAGSGGKYPYGLIASSQRGDGYEQGSALTDKTTTGTPSGGYLVTYSPILVGEAEDTRIGICLWGDSIFYGQYEHNAAALGDALGNHGYMERALGAAGFDFLNMGVPSTAGSQYAADTTRMRRRLAMMEDCCDTLIMGLWRNDPSLTDAQHKANREALLPLFRARGLRIGLTTAIPYTASAANTAPANATWEGYRIADNTRIRALGIVGQDFMLDVADAAESGRNTGLFAADVTTQDGTHPLQAGHAAIASRLPAAMLTAALNAG